MDKVAVFIDGEYLRKIFIKREYRVDIELFNKWIIEKTRIEKKNILRTYFYTSPPYQGTTPTDDEKKRYGNFQKFHNFLKKLDAFEIRLGRTEKRDKGFNQKKADVLLSVDLVYLGIKGKISEVIIVAGDSDFVPAISKVKDEGIKITLICSFDKNEYHTDLKNHVDHCIHISAEEMEKCSKKQSGLELQQKN